MFFNFEEVAKGMLQQGVWLLVIFAVVVGLIGYASQGVGSAIAKVAGAIAVIAFLVALTRGQEIGEWLVEQVFTLDSAAPMIQIGALKDGIQLYTRI
ncbi:hypothetical protein [Enterococcus sp. 5H]|uniref:hypothetical protein n=1 Tax=Enterococcus sp. 5H TaxID=1229490 RepID=UPI002303EBAF|nr:hypothetical protein [Enterococcus sp. 5H]MDA9469891.1 hypothetical protein [Enterococcus sp. 5H]